MELFPYVYWSLNRGVVGDRMGLDEAGTADFMVPIFDPQQSTPKPTTINISVVATIIIIIIIIIIISCYINLAYA